MKSIKSAHANEKTPSQDTKVFDRLPSAGPDGLAISPPAYGIASLDQNTSQVVTQREKIGFEFETKNIATPDAPAPVNNPAQNLWALPEAVDPAPLEMVTGPMAGAATAAENHITEEEAQKKAGGASIQKKAVPENRTGLPDALKSGVESLSRLAMDDRRVHYNSSRPAALQALAYAQGTDIHVASGQERHVPHEAWHVAQQKQGRVTPDNSIANMPIHDSPAADHAPEAVVQRVKSQQERSTAQSETAMANKAVKLLKGQLQPVLKEHIFSAKPTTGVVDTAAPVGLHAYTGGSLPGSLASVDTRGSENRVHGLEWKWRGKSATKRSSMFPTWMSDDRVCTYIALEYSTDTDVVQTDLTQLLLDNEISKSKAQYRISQGMNPELEKKGDTVYPVNEGLRAWIEGDE